MSQIQVESVVHDPSVVPDTRADHLAWCKERALEYVEQDNLTDAVASMLSDLGKHNDTAGSLEFGRVLGMSLLMSGPTKQQVTDFITGFN